MCQDMTTYNESKIFCEIEDFILSILAGEIDAKRFKQQIVPLIKASRRFFIDGNNYIAAIIIFKRLEQALFEAIQFKFYDTIQNLPEQVIESLIQYVQSYSIQVEADYELDQKQHCAFLKKTEKLFIEVVQQSDHLMIFPIKLEFKIEASAVLRFYDVDSYLHQLLKMMRVRNLKIFRSVHSAVWYMRQDPDLGYYIQFCFIYAENEQNFSICTSQIAAFWLEITNGFGQIELTEQELKGLSVNCYDDKQVNNALLSLRNTLDTCATDHYLRVMRNRRKAFDCEQIKLIAI